MHNLAWSYVDLEKLSEAKELQRQLVENRNRVLGPEHPDTLNRVSYLAEIYSRLEKWDEVKRLKSAHSLNTEKHTDESIPKPLPAWKALPEHTEI
jgi:hypothetical protein